MSFRAGAKAGKIQWPTPSRITLGPVTSYGYENEVTLLTKIKVPQDSVAGSVFPIKAKVKWLVCEETCIPQKVDLALDLPVVLPGADAGTGSPLIELARASLPVASPWPISLAYSKDVLSLRITDAKLQSSAVKNIWFYPDEWGKVAHGAEQPWQLSGDTLELQLKPGDARLSPGESLTGVLAITQETGSGPVTHGYSVKVAGDAVVSEITPLKAVVSDIAPVKAGGTRFSACVRLAAGLIGWRDIKPDALCFAGAVHQGVGLNKTCTACTFANPAAWTWPTHWAYWRVLRCSAGY